LTIDLHVAILIKSCPHHHYPVRRSRLKNYERPPSKPYRAPWIRQKTKQVDRRLSLLVKMGLQHTRQRLVNGLCHHLLTLTLGMLAPTVALVLTPDVLKIDASIAIIGKIAPDVGTSSITVEMQGNAHQREIRRRTARIVRGTGEIGMAIGRGIEKKIETGIETGTEIATEIDTAETTRSVIERLEKIATHQIVLPQYLRTPSKKTVHFRGLTHPGTEASRMVTKGSASGGDLQKTRCEETFYPVGVAC
jgi:hypothetical protein